jgi:ATP-dependent DNA ligase
MATLDEIRHIATQHHIITPANRLWGATKDQLMNKLAHKLNTNLLPQLAIMKAHNLRDSKEQFTEAVLKSGPNSSWIAETKLNGIRGKFHLLPNCNRIDSSNRSNVTYEYVEKTECLPHFMNLTHQLKGTILDGELIMPVTIIDDGKTQTTGTMTTTAAVVNSKPKRAIELQEKYGECLFYAFDILFYCGEDVRKRPYYWRYNLLRQVQEHLPILRLPERCETDFHSFFRKIIDTGGEGIMLKQRDAVYNSNKRSRAWYKYKKRSEVDCFVTGSTPGEGEFSGLVGSLLMSVLDPETGECVEIASVQPGDLAFRNKISQGDGSLVDDMYEKVYTISYYCVTKDCRLRTAVIEEPCPHKDRHNCYGNAEIWDDTQHEA